MNQTETAEAKARTAAAFLLAGPAADRRWSGLPPHRRKAFHEAAHCLLALWYEPLVPAVHLVSIIPHGESAGRVLFVGHDPDAVCAQGQVVNDQQRAISVLRDAFTTRERLEVELYNADHQARALVSHFEPEISAVARVLARRRELSIEQVGKILTKYYAARERTRRARETAAIPGAPSNAKKPRGPYARR